jgi:hypothetical protein
MSRYTGRRLSQDIRRTFSDLSSAALFADVTLKCRKDNKAFFCHSFVLRKASRLIEELLKATPIRVYNFPVESTIMRYAIDLMYLGQVVYPVAVEQELEHLLKIMGVKVRNGVEILGSRESLLDHAFLLHVESACAE